MNAKWMVPILCLALTGCNALADICAGVGEAIAEDLNGQDGARVVDRSEGTERQPSRPTPPSGPIDAAPVRSPRPVAQGPNLGTSIHRLPSGTLIAGRRYELSARVRNHGDRPARPTFAALMMRQDGRRPYLLGQKEIPSLRPGQDAELVLDFVPPNTGAFCFALDIDPRRMVPEPDHARSDNHIEFRRTVVAARPRPTR